MDSAPSRTLCLKEQRAAAPVTRGEGPGHGRWAGLGDPWGGTHGWLCGQDALGGKVTTTANPGGVATHPAGSCKPSEGAGDLQADAEQRGPSATCPLRPHLEKRDFLYHIHLDPV